MADTQEVLKRTIKQQKKHIEILRSHNEFLQGELNRKKLSIFATKSEYGSERFAELNSQKSRFFDSDWFYFLHGAMMGIFIHVYTHNYEIIRDFYY
ncbi:MAG: hypothetical protein RL839_05460 [Gammaproteobacteria bacterium]